MDSMGLDMCRVEGCRGRGNCPDCGRVNYRLLGYYGAVGRWSKVWSLMPDQTEDRMARHFVEREVRRGEMSEADAKAIFADLIDQPS